MDSNLIGAREGPYELHTEASWAIGAEDWLGESGNSLVAQSLDGDDLTELSWRKSCVMPTGMYVVSFSWLANSAAAD